MFQRDRTRVFMLSPSSLLKHCEPRPSNAKLLLPTISINRLGRVRVLRDNLSKSLCTEYSLPSTMEMSYFRLVKVLST